MKVAYDQGYNEPEIRKVCPFLVDDVLFNVAAVRSGRDRAEIARELGADGNEFDLQTDHTSGGLNEKLWSEEHSIYFDWDIVTDYPSQVQVAARFSPLDAGVPTQEPPRVTDGDGGSRRMFDETESHLGPVEILVNNAGIQIAGASHETSAGDFDRVIGVNLRGAYLCAREAIRRWIDRASPGIILNVSSVHDTIPKPGYLSYSISKGGMRNLPRALALEYSDQGIRMNADCSWLDDAEKRAVAVFLASDEAGYITGQTIYVDGGLTLFPGFKENWTS